MGGKFRKRGVHVRYPKQVGNGSPESSTKQSGNGLISVPFPSKFPLTETRNFAQ